jgi:hypothetical protein
MTRCGARVRDRGSFARRLATGARAAALLAVALAAGASPARGADRWGAELHLGGAWNLPLPLRIRQEGHGELRHDARWETRAFEYPLYYTARLLGRRDARGWMLDLTHHKLHLANPPAEVGHFAISHGYNLLTAYRLVEHGERRLGLGAGVVVAHPENTVRGERLDEHRGALGLGYHLAGPSLGMLASWLPGRRDGAYFVAEARLTLSHAGVPIARGTAWVPNVALHLTVGAGWEGAR